ncbi:DUF2793 domain-containing protein [Sphingomonas sp. LY29]|uniref:DUF2793 domain-containing protein n=1 Tax=Sphingomonas sp. LY29 TaxID=3095341 RepID=UPI002D79BF2B|nr:DUF2793 domain-containing protein [Sphingomonas sp. LY29]WRP27049.1 DUF2793 domain-containing protein [Sphingomonas sp. LY29]
MAGQAQEEVFHNEALSLLDALIVPVVEDGAHVEPPTDAVVGRCFRIGAERTGAWIGREGQLAAFGEGGWRYIDPPVGMRVTERSSGLCVHRRNGDWQVGIEHLAEVRVEGVRVIGKRAAPIDQPAGGATVDSECRETVAAILAAMKGHGLIGS